MFLKDVNACYCWDETPTSGESYIERKTEESKAAHATSEKVMLIGMVCAGRMVGNVAG